jgi:hypothetical protein
MEDLRRAYEAEANASVLTPIEFARFTDMMRQLSTFWLALVELPLGTEASGQAASPMSCTPLLQVT